MRSEPGGDKSKYCTSPDSGESFFTGELVVDPQELAKVPNVKLVPGMPAQAIIVTGNRSILDYLMSPFTSTFADAMHER